MGAWAFVTLVLPCWSQVPGENDKQLRTLFLCSFSRCPKSRTALGSSNAPRAAWVSEFRQTNGSQEQDLRVSGPRICAASAPAAKTRAASLVPRPDPRPEVRPGTSHSEHPAPGPKLPLPCSFSSFSTNAGRGGRPWRTHLTDVSGTSTPELLLGPWPSLCCHSFFGHSSPALVRSGLGAPKSPWHLQSLWRRTETGPNTPSTQTIASTRIGETEAPGLGVDTRCVSLETGGAGRERRAPENVAPDWPKRWGRSPALSRQRSRAEGCAFLSSEPRMGPNHPQYKRHRTILGAFRAPGKGAGLVV